MLSDSLSDSFRRTYLYIMQKATRINGPKRLFEQMFQTVFSCFNPSQLKLIERACRLKEIKKKLGTILNEKLFTIKTLCEYLGISRSTLHRLIQQGKIEPFHIGSATRFTSAEVDRFITRQLKQARIQEVGFDVVR